MRSHTSRIRDTELPPAVGGPWWIAVPAFAGAAAALALPGPAGSAAGVAGVLLLGALALLAGHTWGLLVIAVADVLLLGHVWPLMAFSGGDPHLQLAAAAALSSALPGLALLGVALPALVDLVLDHPPAHVRSAGVVASAVGMGLALVLPAF